MRIQRVVLEYHCDIPVLGLDVVDYHIAYRKLACADIFQTRYHSQRGGFSAAGGSYEYYEFLILDFHIEIVYGFGSVRIDLIYMF